MSAKRRYVCNVCHRVTVTGTRRRVCPLLEVVPPGLFRKPIYRCPGKLIYAPIVRKVKTPSPVDAVKTAEAKLARALTRLRRAATNVKRWERAVKRARIAVRALPVTPAGVPYVPTGRGDRALDLSE